MFSTISLGALLVTLLVAIVIFVIGQRSIASRDLSRRLRKVLDDQDAADHRSSKDVLLGRLSVLGASVQQLSIISEKDMAELARTVRSAGYSVETAVPLVIGGKLVLMIACPVVTLLLTKGLTMPWPIIYTAIGAALGLFGPNMAISQARKKRQKALRLGLSDALDLLVVCAEAGLGLESAIDRVATEMQNSTPQVAEEFAILGQDLRLSSDRGAALLRMGERTGLESFQRLTSTLSQTLRYGTPLGQALRLLASEMRADRLLRLEEKAAKLPTLLTMPLAMFILPCLFIVVAGPAALRIMAMMK